MLQGSNLAYEVDEGGRRCQYSPEEGIVRARQGVARTGGPDGGSGDGSTRLNTTGDDLRCS